MADVPTGSRRSPPRGLLGWGVFLLFTFFAATQTVDGLEVQFRIPSNAFASSELLFWISACAFLIPGSTLLGVAYAARIGEGWSRFTTALDQAKPLERRMMIVVVGIFAFCLARGGNQGVLLGLPFTDDEYGVRLGGHLLAHGQVRAALPAFVAVAPLDSLFIRGREIASMDFPGAIAIAALAELTRSGTFIASLLAGITAVCITALTVRRHGPRFGMLGGALALTSPSIVLLSMTSHPHVASRAFLALGLAALLFVRERSFGRGVAGGFALTLAASVRPFELLPLMLPLWFGIALDARKDAAERRLFFGMLVGAIPPLLAIAAFDVMANGSVLFSRLVASDLPDRYRHLRHAAIHPSRWWSLFAGNVPSDLVALAVFVAGPLGLPLAWIGRRFDSTHARLFVGVVLAFVCGLFRFAPSIHAAGPLHLADASVPLVLLACAGAKTTLDFAERQGASRRWIRGGIAGYVGLGLPIFVLFQAVALARHAEVQESIYRRIESITPRPAVVLVPPYLAVVGSTPIGASTGTFIVGWRPPLLDASEPVIVLADRRRSRADVARWFPNRSAHVLLLKDTMGYEIVPLASLPLPTRSDPAGSAAADARDGHLLDPIGNEAGDD